MKILVDADACPVKEIIISLAKQRNISVIMLVDTSHQLNDGYSTVITVDKAADSVDYLLMERHIGAKVRRAGGKTKEPTK